MKLIRQILQRITEPTPEFFKKVRLLGKFMLAFVVLVLGVNKYICSLPECVIEFSNKYVTLAGLLTMFFSSMASAVRDQNGEIDPVKFEANEKRKREESSRMYDNNV